MKEETLEKLKKIKSRYHLLMNGVASRSMRSKGSDYAINFGVSLPELKLIAKEFDKDFELSLELWKDNVRESKILSTLLMPEEEFSFDLAEIFLSQTPNQEIAEMLSFNLLQYINGAKDLALRWLSRENELMLLSGYSVLARLFMRGESLSDREINEFIDQAGTAISDDSMMVRRAANNALLRFSQISDEHEKIVKSAFGKHIDF